MSDYINETARAYITVFHTLPTEIQAEIKKMLINKTEKRKIDFSLFATKGWSEKNKKYSREELYD